jgi:beta-lactamase regulating signal transducer with metallopeptidase domain
VMSWEAASFTLIYACAAVSAWLATYAVHSTLIIAGLWTLHRLRAPAPEQQEMIWKLALLGGIVTASVMIATGLSPLTGRYETAAVIEASWSTAPNASSLLRVVPLVIVSLWILYAAAVLLKVLYTTLHARRSLGARMHADDATRSMVAAVASTMGLRHPVDVTISEVLSSPVVLGRSEITLPTRVLTDFTPEEQRSIVAHELAHVIRNDPWWLMLAATIESLFFFQLFNRMARMKWQESTEYMCDEMAVRTEGSRLPLARSLARVAEWTHGTRGDVPHLLAPALAEEPSTLLGRVKQILEHDRKSTTTSQATLVLTMLAIIVLVAGGSPAFAPGSVRGWGKPAFNWSGAIAPGQSIEVQGVIGSIHAVPTDGNNVIVRATRHGRSTNPDIRFEVVRTDTGVTICALYPTPATVSANRCVPGRTGQFNTKSNDVEVEFLVSVPESVGLIASSATGNVTSEVLSGPITAHSSSGKIDVAMSVAAWTGKLELESKSGDVKVTLPRNANVEIAAETRTGTIKSDFAIGAAHQSFFSRLKLRGSLGTNARGVVGQGGRALNLSTIAGNISIKAR